MAFTYRLTNFVETIRMRFQLVTSIVDHERILQRGLDAGSMPPQTHLVADQCHFRISLQKQPESTVPGLKIKTSIKSQG